jgi:hypothetical protein
VGPLALALQVVVEDLGVNSFVVEFKKIECSEWIGTSRLRKVLSWVLVFIEMAGKEVRTSASSTVDGLI